MNKDLTIIFVTYFSEKNILRYLRQFKNKYKVIIVENSGDISLKNKIEKISKAKVIMNKVNTGFGSGVNIALKKIKTKFALHLDLDTKFDNKSIDQLFKKATFLKDFAILTPKIKSFKYNSNNFIKKKIRTNTNQMNFVDGCCLFFNVKEIKNIGYFDSNYFLYYEETDLIKRLVNNSKNVLMIDNIFISHTGGSSGDISRVIIEENRNWHYMWSKFYYYRKHYNYFYALTKIFRHLTSSLLKSGFYLLYNNEIKKKIYKARLSGCINAMLFRKSWFRPKI